MNANWPNRLSVVGPGVGGTEAITRLCHCESEARGEERGRERVRRAISLEGVGLPFPIALKSNVKTSTQNLITGK